MLVSKQDPHINGIENMWGQAKWHVRRFNKIPKNSVFWFLKECDRRFSRDCHAALLYQLKTWYRAAINSVERRQLCRRNGWMGWLCGDSRTKLT